MVDDAKGKGAGVALGGTKCEARGGLYYLPTILTDVNSTMDIFREEIFGPVVSIIKFKHEEVGTFIFFIPYMYRVDPAGIFFCRRAHKMARIPIEYTKLDEFYSL